MAEQAGACLDAEFFHDGELVGGAVTQDAEASLVQQAVVPRRGQQDVPPCELALDAQVEGIQLDQVVQRRPVEDTRARPRRTPGRLKRAYGGS